MAETTSLLNWRTGNRTTSSNLVASANNADNQMMIVGVVFLLKSGLSSVTPKEYINFVETIM